MSRMTTEQRAIYERIMESVLEVQADPLNVTVQRCFMLEGPGGTGKTLINETLIASCNALSLKVLPTAFTGIASQLLPGGKTLHSTLKIPLDLDESTPPQIEPQSARAQVLRDTAMVIIDEVSMLPGRVLGYASRQLQDVQYVRQRKAMPFGGVITVLTGNWAQLPPVEKSGGGPAQRNASVKMSALFINHFETFTLRQNMRVGPGEGALAEWLLQVAEGRNFVDAREQPALRNCIAIPEVCRAHDSDALIEHAYPIQLLQNPLLTIDVMRGSCVLAPLRATVKEVNDRINDKVPGDSVILQGFDYLTTGGRRRALDDVRVADEDVENLHARTPDGWPPYEFRVKVGSICIMLATYDPFIGLFNGTRVQILDFIRDRDGEMHLLKVRILDGKGKDKVTMIARSRFKHGIASNNQNRRENKGIPFDRLQFPVQPGWCLTVTKAQGQTFQRVGLYLQDGQCFGHGMAYTALSRVTSAAGLSILSNRGAFMENYVDYTLLGLPRPTTFDPLPSQYTLPGIFVGPMGNLEYARNRGDGREIEEDAVGVSAQEPSAPVADNSNVDVDMERGEDTNVSGQPEASLPFQVERPGTRSGADQRMEVDGESPDSPSNHPTAHHSSDQQGDGSGFQR